MNQLSLEQKLDLAVAYLIERKRYVLKGFTPTPSWGTNIRSTITNYRKENSGTDCKLV